MTDHEGLGTPVPTEDPKDHRIDYKSIMDRWNQLATKYNLCKIIKLSEKRKKGIRARLAEPEFVLDTIISEIESSDFLLGRRSTWQVHFDFVFCSPNNYLKILEGRYRNRTNGGSRQIIPPADKYTGVSE